MIDADIVKLSKRDPGGKLDGLEAQIWVRVAERAAARKDVRTVAAYQMAVMAFAMIGSISAGLVLASGAPAPQVANIALPGIELAPSQLLFGISQ